MRMVGHRGWDGPLASQKKSDAHNYYPLHRRAPAPAKKGSPPLTIPNHGPTHTCYTREGGNKGWRFGVSQGLGEERGREVGERSGTNKKAPLGPTGTV